jgi:DNA-binding response OmpR family regulator
MSKNSRPRIIIIEDEVDLANIIAEQLENAGMEPHICDCGSKAIAYLKENFANLILLDLNLPDGSGFGLLEELHATGIIIPVIFVTGVDSEVQKVKGLEMGGDDYITKPFSYPELIARIHAVLRRAETARDLNISINTSLATEPFNFCAAEVNPQRMEIIFTDGEVEKIGRKELGILMHLVSNNGAVLTRKALIHAVWGVHADVKSRSMDQYVVKIRELFKRHGMSLDNFRTVHGVGYIYDS